MLTLFICIFSAKEWAFLAGRDDLAEKKIENLSKYYLCSEHFTIDDMTNPEIEDKSLLRLKKINDMFPLPSIFEDNLMRNVVTAKQNAEKFSTYSKTRDSSGPSSMIIKRRYNVTDRLKKEGKKPKFNNTVFVDCDYMTEDNLIEMRQDENEYADINTYCRLCAKTSMDLIAIFDEMGNYHAETDCFRMMPSDLIGKDDGLPQFTCSDCLDKLQSCANVIDSFVANQNCFVTD